MKPGKLARGGTMCETVESSSRNTWVGDHGADGQGDHARRVHQQCMYVTELWPQQHRSAGRIT